MRKIQITLILCLAVVAAGILYWINKDNNVQTNEEGKTGISPTQVKSIEEIGQWEFLTVTDEEMVDTVRRGFFGDDELIRIYYGILRLGIDMKDVKEDWMQADGDTIVCTLPPVKLLDHNFIDEARTRSFHEEGKWTGKDRQAMYDRAYARMKIRCLSKSNMASAEQNALKQFGDMLRAMGFTYTKIRFEQ